MIDANDSRDPIEKLAEEFLERFRRGEKVTATQYAEQYPGFAEDIHEVFPALLALEKAKPVSIVPPQIKRIDSLIAPGSPTKLGGYRVCSKISHGGMGVVYQAEDVALGRQVAIKVLAANWSSDDAALKRFKREAKTVARLHHTNIVSVFGAGQENGIHYFVMELIDGQSLHAAIASGDYAKLFFEDWRWIAESTRDVALALNHAHEKGVMHRDVKPANLLIDADGKLWITDFGLAKFFENDDLTRPGDAVGTLRYMAPEQLKGNPEERSDLFSLGLVMYELLTGERIFDQSDSENFMARITKRDLPNPRSINPNIPEDLEKIALKAIAIDPADRYQSGAALASDLERWCDDRPILARRLSTWQRVYRWARRNRLVAALSAALCVLMLTLFIAFGQVVFALLGESSAKLDARIAQTAAEESRNAAETNLLKAMQIVDRLTADLAVFNRLETGEANQFTFLFSPMGGLPVSARTEKQLDLIDDFYRSVGKSEGMRKEVQYRKLLANIRSSEIALQLKRPETASETLANVIDDLRKATDADLISLKLYAGDLLGYAKLQAGELETARRAFVQQLKWVKDANLPADQRILERGKAFLGMGMVAHNEGNIEQWHGNIRNAISELEKSVHWEAPSESPAAAVFLARSYHNIPPRFNVENYSDFHLNCKTRAVVILSDLHRRQLEKKSKSGVDSSMLFFYDYCIAVAAVPDQIESITLDEEEISVPDLLSQTITQCIDYISDAPEVPSIRFALARLQVQLALRVPEQFDELAGQAQENIQLLADRYPKDSILLTEAGTVYYHVAVRHLARREFKDALKSLQVAQDYLEKSLLYANQYPRTQVLLPIVHTDLGLVYEELNDLRAARYHKNHAAELKKRYPHPHWTAGQ